MQVKSLKEAFSRDDSFQSSFMPHTLKKALQTFATKMDECKQNIKQGNFNQLPSTTDITKDIQNQFIDPFLDICKGEYKSFIASSRLLNCPEEDWDDKLKESLLGFFNKIKEFLEQFGDALPNIFEFYDSLNTLDSNLKNFNKVLETYEECKKSWETISLSWNRTYRKDIDNSKQNIKGTQLNDFVLGRRIKTEGFLELFVNIYTTWDIYFPSIIEATDKKLEMLKLQLGRTSSPKKSLKKIPTKRAVFKKDRVQQKNYPNESSPEKPSLKDYKIFPNGLPLPGEIKQRIGQENGIGDCYLIEVLAQLAKNDPKAIRDCFTQTDEILEKANLVSIRLFDIKRSVVKENRSDGFLTIKYLPNKPRVFVIARDGLDMKGTESWFGKGTYKALWPMFLEEAFALLRKTHGNFLSPEEEVEHIQKTTGNSEYNIRDFLKGGNPAPTLAALTGRPGKLKVPISRMKALPSTNDDFRQLLEKEFDATKEDEANFDKIRKALNKKRSVSCGFRGTDPENPKDYFLTNDPIKNEAAIVFFKHIYGIIDAFTQNSQKILTLENPHKMHTVVLDNGYKVFGGYRFNISYDDFKKYVRNVLLSSKPGTSE